MEHDPHSNPTPAPTGAHVPSLSPAQERRAVLDAHGFDLADFDWIPVKRKPRVDGWSVEKQRLFIATLADTGSVTQAARAVGMSVKSAYALRRAPDGAGFDRAWRAAIRHAMHRLIDVCMERALEGTEEPIYDREGRHIGHRVKHHDRMAMFLLRAHMPDLFRDAHRADRAKGEQPPPAPEPVAEALQRLDPVPPADPAALMNPDELTTALQTAAIGDGALPRWRRDPDLVAREREEQAAARGGEQPAASPVLNEDFERRLDAAKAGTYEGIYGARGKRARRRAAGRASG